MEVADLVRQRLRPEQSPWQRHTAHRASRILAARAASLATSRRSRTTTSARTHEVTHDLSETFPLLPPSASRTSRIPLGGTRLGETSLARADRLLARRGTEGWGVGVGGQSYLESVIGHCEDLQARQVLRTRASAQCAVTWGPRVHGAVAMEGWDWLLEGKDQPGGANLDERRELVEPIRTDGQDLELQARPRQQRGGAGPFRERARRVQLRESAGEAGGDAT